MEKLIRCFLLTANICMAVAITFYLYAHTTDEIQTMSSEALQNILQHQIFSNVQDAQRAYQSLVLFLGETDFQHIQDIKKMSGGLSGATIFEFKIREHHYAARFFANDFNRYELRAEIEAHKKAADVALAPRLVWHDFENGFMVMEFLQGIPLSKDLYTEERLKLCLQMLSKLHNASLISQKNPHCFLYDKNRIGCDALGLLAVCAQKHPESVLIKKLQMCAQQLSNVANVAPHEKALVHNDIHCGNIFFKDADSTLQVIDWADAGYDNRFNDCVIIAHEFVPQITTMEQFIAYHFSSTYHDKILTYYLNRLPLEFERAWFRILIRLYRLENLSKIMLKPQDEVVSEADDYKNAFQRCFDEYLTSEVVNQELAHASGLKVLSYKALIDDIIQYVEHEFLTDTKILFTIQ